MGKKAVEIVSRNLALKIFSLILAILLWFYIQIVQNPEVSYEIFEVPISISGEANINSEGYVLSRIMKSMRVNVTVSAKRSMIHMIDTADFTAVIDVSQCDDTGEFDLPIKVRSSDSEITVVNKSPSEIPVYIDRITTIKKPVKVAYNGTLDPNYCMDKNNIVFEPSEVSIKVPELLKDTVDCLEVAVDMTGAKSDISAEFKGVLIDENGDMVTDKNISSSIDKVSVTVPVFRRKTLPIRIIKAPVSGEYKLSADTIEIAGPEDVVSKLNYIEGYVESYDPDKTEYSYKVTLKLDNLILPNETKDIMLYPDVQQTIGH